MIGKKFGDWEVVEEGPTEKDKKTGWSSHKTWKCRCKCGVEKFYSTSYLNFGKKTTCCIECRKKLTIAEDAELCAKYLGKTIGSYTIVELLPRNEYGSRMWLCRCKCGLEKKFLSCYLFGKSKKKATLCRKCCIEQMEMECRITDRIPNRFWQRFLDHTKRREIEVLISQEDAYNLYVRQQRKCALSGIDLYFTTLRTNFNRYTNASIDRIDSSKPYAIDNIQWVHKTINMMKQQFSQKEFVEMCKLVTANQISE